MAGGRYAPLDEAAARGLLGDLRTDEDVRLCLPYCPDDRRGGALALHALARELADAPGRVSEAPLGLIRFQWWREAIAEAFGEGTVRRHPLALALAETVGAVPDMRAPLGAMIDGAEGALELDGPPVTVAEAVNLASPLHGPLGTALCVWLTGSEEKDEVVGHALALTAAARAASGEPARGRGLPRASDLIASGPPAGAYADAVARHRRTLRNLPADLVPAALPFALAPAYVDVRAPGPLARRTRLFRTVLTGRF